MNFQPKTEQEIADSKLWKKGDYDFEVTDADEKRSKAGHPMIELKLRLSYNGARRTLTDYLLEEMPEKLRHASEACGLLDRYKTGSVSSTDFLGKRGKLKLGIDKDRKHKYPDKNVVLDYVCASSANDNAKKGDDVLSFD